MNRADTIPVRHLLDRIVRRERSRLVGNLVSRLGGARLDLAEDVTQEALATALASWPYQGLPDDPAAWLSRVARNKAYDRLRREGRERPYDPINDLRIAEPEHHHGTGPEQDPDLRLIWLCCLDALSERDRLALTVKIAGGFTTGEVAGLFLCSEGAMTRRLTRAKRTLREVETKLGESGQSIDLSTRLAPVMKVIYLMFAFGYAPRGGERSIRSDVVLEALRMARLLVSHATTANAEAAALCALLCFQASRLTARESDDGAVILMEFQDRSAWDRNLIAEGVEHLDAAKRSPTLSRYHLEAGIAAAHALSPDRLSCDWNAIVRLYDHLEHMTRSPVVTVNASVALAVTGEAERALKKLQSLTGLASMQNYAPFHLARGDVLERLSRSKEACEAYDQALQCSVSEPVAEAIRGRLRGCVR